MYLLKAKNICVEYGDRTIFDIDSLELHEASRVGLVGHNGAGKTTLLSVLSGEREPDDGSVDIRGAVAYVRQEQNTAHLRTAGSATANRKRPCAFERPELSEMPSGGELTRAALAAAFATGADILLADEPTTNLDVEGIERLQGELQNHRGALVLISHDRELLDQVCTEIWEIDAGKLRIFPGNYTAWLEQREREREHAAFEYDAYRSEKKRLERSARKMSERAKGMLKPPSRMSPSEARLCANKEKALVSQSGVYAKARAISKRAGMLEEKERPKDLPEIKMALGARNPLRSPYAIRASGLSVSFGGARERVLFENASFDIVTNKKTVLTGRNGSGKTTLLEMIRRGADGIKQAPGLKAGYFSQNHDVLDLSRTVLDNARALSSLPEHEVRTILARLEIKGDDVHKTCGVLSGGERAKVAFARLFASDLNTLILDEPTNHIDLYTLDALEALLTAWSGTLLLVTHDRRLAERVGERFLMIEDGRIRAFEGTLWEYRSHRAIKEDVRPELEESLRDMRLAELSARIDAAKNAEERERWEAEWRSLVNRGADAASAK